MEPHNRSLNGLIGALSLSLGLSACVDDRDMDEGLDGVYGPGGGYEDGDDTGEDTEADSNDGGGGDGEDDAGTEDPPGDDGGGGDPGDDGDTSTGDGPDDGDDDEGDAGHDDPWNAERDLCLELINEYRATLGVSPLSRWTGQAAEECVDGQAKTDSLEYGGVHAEFGKCGEALQNEGGWNGPFSPGFEMNLDGMWGEGPGGGHYENMASPMVTEVLCGFYQSTTGQYAGWWSAVQDFR
jgi:hypothetical protein